MSKTVKAEAKRGGVTLFLLGYFVYCMVYVCRNSISIVQSEMGFGDGEFSFLVAALLACYAVGRLLNGYLGDKIPRNIMIGTGITVAGACHVAMGLLYPLHLFPLLVVLWALNGYAQSMIWGPLLDGVYRRMGGKKIVATLLVSSVGAGSILAVVCAQQLALHLGVLWAFVLPGAVSVAAGAAAFFAFREKKEATPKTNEASPADDVEAPLPKPRLSPKTVLRELFRFDRIGLWLIPAVLHGVFKDNLATYAPDFFANVYSVNLKDMALFVFAIPLLTLAGRLLYPLLLRLFRDNENAVSLVGFALCALSVLPPLFGFGGIALCAVCLAVFAAAISLINTTMLSVYPLRFSASGHVSSVTGLLDFAVYLAGAIASFAYGLLDGMGHVMYTAMFASWLACALLGAVAVPLLARREKQAK